MVVSPPRGVYLTVEPAVASVSGRVSVPHPTEAVLATLTLPPNSSVGVSPGAQYLVQQSPLNPIRHCLTLNSLFPRLWPMRSHDEHNDPIQSAGYRELQLLSEIETNPEVTQRQLSRRLGIALGLTNVLLRNLAQKGYVRATQAGWKRWLYALTPDGFSHKFRLTAAYIHRVMDHYKNVRQTLREQLQPLALNEQSRVAICGTGEFAELVYLGLREIGIEEIDFYGSTELDSPKFLGMPVHNLQTLQGENYDRVVIALLGAPKDVYIELLQRGTAPEKLITFFVDGIGEEEG